VTGTDTTIRVELALLGFMLRVVWLPSLRLAGKTTRALRGRRLPASFSFPPGATVCESVHAAMHLIQVR
jgi:hypothetical protein